MKTSIATPNKPNVPSLFQLASYFEDFVPAAGLKEFTPASSRTPFADLMLYPEKIEAALKAARAENDAFDESRTINRNDAKRATRSLPPKSGGIKKNKTTLTREIKKVEFFLEAHSASSVKLAADFTNWEKCPLDMIQSEDGVWFSVIPLEPGQYSYRFIVDGQWRDDPRSTRRIPNPFGTENAVIAVS